MSDTEMAQAPPREEEDLFGDEASNDGAHASDAVSYTHLTLPTIYSV